MRNLIQRIKDMKTGTKLAIASGVVAAGIAAGAGYGLYKVDKTLSDPNWYLPDLFEDVATSTMEYIESDN